MKTAQDSSEMSNSRITPAEMADLTIDISTETCPMTYVRTRLALDRLVAGQTLLVVLRGEEPRQSVPRTATAQGHTVLDQGDRPDGTGYVVLRRG